VVFVGNGGAKERHNAIAEHYDTTAPACHTHTYHPQGSGVTSKFADY
jgi:hypothetical protein